MPLPTVLRFKESQESKVGWKSRLDLVTVSVDVSTERKDDPKSLNWGQKENCTDKPSLG